jgi:hypothetical protein
MRTFQASLATSTLIALSLLSATTLVPTQAMAQANVVAAEDLRGILPTSLSDFRPREGLAAASSKSAMSEAAVAFKKPNAAVSVRIHIADLINNPEVYDQFLSSAGMTQAHVTRGVDALFKKTGERSLKEANASWGEKTLNDLGLDEPVTQAIGSLSLRNDGQSKTRMTVRELIDKWSIYGKGQIFDRFGDVPLSRVSVISGAAMREEHVGYGLGIDFSPVERRSNANGEYFFLRQDEVNQFSVGLTEEEIPGGGYSKLYQSTSPDTAGWELYEPNGKYGLLLLGINGRFGVLVEGRGIENTSVLKTAVAGISLTKLGQLATATGVAKPPTRP